MKKILSLLLVTITVFAFVGCSQEAPEVNVPVSDILEAIKEKMAEDMKEAGVSEDNLKDGNLPGYMETDLTSEEQNPTTELFNLEDIEEGIVLQQMINIRSDMIIVLKAKDESKVESLKASLEEVKEGQVNTWSQYLPDQYEKVKNNILKAEGKYLIYVTYDDPEAIEEIFDNLLK